MRVSGDPLAGRSACPKNGGIRGSRGASDPFRGNGGPACKRRAPVGWTEYALSGQGVNFRTASQALKYADRAPIGSPPPGWPMGAFSWGVANRHVAWRPTIDP